LLNALDGGVTEVEALNFVACGLAAANAARPVRWCQAVAGAFNGLTGTPSSLNVPVEECREPRLNHGKSGPFDWASWHSQEGAKLSTDDILEELGIDFIPGHINIDTFFDTLDVLTGVANLDPETLQPAWGDRWLGYGKVQTAAASEKWIRFYDAVARAKGANPVTRPVWAHDIVAHNAITANQSLRINLYPDVPALSKWETVKVGGYKRRLLQEICDTSPWIKDALGDANGGYAKVPLGGGQFCNAGFRLYHPASAQGMGWTLRELAVKFSEDGTIPDDLKARATAIPQIFQEMFYNTDTKVPLLIRDPTSEAPPCAVMLDLGVSRGTPRRADGSLNVDAQDPHFKRMVENFATLLGG
jgi:hypothetical protein